MTTPVSREEALSATLADEYAATYGYGLIAAALIGIPRRRAQSAIDVHRVRRDQLRKTIIAIGQAPPNPAAAYDPPAPVDSAARAIALAAQIENGLSGSYSQLAAQSQGADRRTAALAAQETAVRAAAWTSSTQAFPGTTARAITETESATNPQTAPGAATSTAGTSPTAG